MALVILLPVTSQATASRSMTGLPAQVLNLRDRSIIREGAVADLLVFDLDRLRDRATFKAPYQLSEGSLVNGQAAIANSTFTGAMTGQVLRRQIRLSERYYTEFSRGIKSRWQK